MEKTIEDDTLIEVPLAHQAPRNAATADGCARPRNTDIGTLPVSNEGQPQTQLVTVGAASYKLQDPASEEQT